LLYSNIIKRTYPVFGKFITDKGYRPDDLLTFYGMLNVLKGYLMKVTKKKSVDIDPYRILKTWQINHNFWNNVTISSELFNVKRVKNTESVIKKELIFKILSLSYLINKI
jgi:hypothetical protein